MEQPPPGSSEQQKEESGLYNTHPLNFFLGATYGLCTGYTSDAFSAPPSDRLQMLGMAGSLSKWRIVKFITKKSIWLSSLVGVRMLRRGLLAGFTYDIVETTTAQKHGRHSVFSNLSGLLALTMFFRMSANIRDHVIGSCSLFVSYIIGYHIAKRARRKRRETEEIERTRIRRPREW